MKMLSVAAVALLLLLTGPAWAQGPQPQTVVEGLEFPTGLAFAPDGRMFVNERPGRIRLFSNGRLDPTPIATVPTTEDGETGLLGIALPPDFSSNEVLYVFATTPDGAGNRVWRVPLATGRPEVVIDDLPASLYHNGGGLGFDSDGMLYISNGEQHSDDKAQDPAVLGGKVYRYSAEGEVPGDNPFGDSPAFAIGLRNPYGLAMDPVSGDPFVTENGPSSFDEINHVEAGGNYGWPEISGPSEGGEPQLAEGAYHDPLLAYEGIIVPTGIAFAGLDAADKSVRGDLFFASYGEGAIHRVELNEDRTTARSDEIIVADGEPKVAVAWGPDGLYYGTTSAVKTVAFAGAGAGPKGSTEAGGDPTTAEAGDPETSEPRTETNSTLTFVSLAAVAVITAVVFFLRRSRSG